MSPCLKSWFQLKFFHQIVRDYNIFEVVVTDFMLVPIFKKNVSSRRQS